MERQAIPCGILVAVKRHPLLVASCLLAALPGCRQKAVQTDLTLVVRGPGHPRPRCVRGTSRERQPSAAGPRIRGARVTLEPGGLSGKTDRRGQVTFKGVRVGAYTLKVRGKGHAPLTRKLHLTRLPSQPNRPGVPTPRKELTITAGATAVRTVRLLPCIGIAGRRALVGYGARVTLQARSRCDGWTGVRYRWSQVRDPGTPDVTAGVALDQDTLTFTTAPLARHRAIPREPQQLSLSPDEAGQYVIRLEARASAGVSVERVLVTAASVSGPVPAVPPYGAYYFVGREEGPWQWHMEHLDERTRRVKPGCPRGWRCDLIKGDARVVGLRLAPPGARHRSLLVNQRIFVKNKHSDMAFGLYVATWNSTPRTCGVAECHPEFQQAWAATPHATTWRRLLDGELAAGRDDVGESCAACHALGYEPNRLRNWGYNHVARTSRVDFPPKREAGTYAKLPQNLQEVSNVYCLACHGPARLEVPGLSQRGKHLAGVCATCHDRKPEQDLVAQWRTSRMARSADQIENAVRAYERCAGCHTARGFYDSRFAPGKGPKGRGTALLGQFGDPTAPVTCQACHSPMHRLNDAQVWLHGTVKTRGGLSVPDVGPAAVCMPCHNTQHDVTRPETLKKRLAPHAGHADLGYGRAGYPMGGGALSGSTCFSAKRGCVHCHMDPGPGPKDPDHRKVGSHTFRMVSAGKRENLRPCKACHPGLDSLSPPARGDYDGDGRAEDVRAEVDGLLALLQTRLRRAIAAAGLSSPKRCGAGARRGAWIGDSPVTGQIVVLDRRGRDLGDCNGDGKLTPPEKPFVLPDRAVKLHKAAYNYLLVEGDGSRGLHNYPFTVKLLQRTVAALGSAPGWAAFAPREKGGPPRNKAP